MLRLETLTRTVIALVWLINGLYAKVLGGVPRHREIVARLFGDHWAGWIIVMIGLAEVVMAIWVWSRWKHRFCAWTQIAVVMTMNIIEQAATPDILLWGRMNFIYAVLFCAVVWLHTYRLAAR